LQRQCGQGAFNGYGNVEAAIGCDDWTCVCNHFSMAQTSLLALVSSACSSEQDISSATSIFDGFCSQLPISTLAPPPFVVTDPAQWPGFNDQRQCGQGAFNGYGNVQAAIECDDWTCVCNYFSAAQTSLLSIVLSVCSSVEQDVSSATSIFDAFCSQLPGVTVTASATAAVAGATATATTATSTCNNSEVSCTNLL